MKKTLITLTTVTVVGLGSVFFSAPASADSLEDLRQQETQVQQEREDLKANLSSAEAEIADLIIDLEEANKEIERINEALEENKATMDKNEKDIEKTDKAVEQLEEEIKELEESIQKRFEILKERAVSYQKNGGNISYIEVLFGAQNFSDFISRVTAINKITKSDASLIEEIDKDKAEVEKKQDEVLEKLDELKEMRTELKGMDETIKEQKAQSNEKKATLKDKEDELVAQVQEIEMEDSRLASLQSDIVSNIETMTQPAPEVQVASNSTTESESTTTNSSSSSDNSSTSVEKETKSEPKKEVARSSASGGVSTAINAGFAHLGTPYVWAGKGPGGFDCSGFVSWAFAQGGISIPSNTGGLAGTGTKVSASNMQPGDIVFFDTYKTNGHVGIYLGGGQFIGAQNSTGLAVANMSSGYWADKFNGHVRSVR